MKNLRLKFGIILAFVAAMVGLSASEASAYTGSWTSTQNVLCGSGNGFYLQGHYEGDSLVRRADGYAVTVTSGNGYIRTIRIREWANYNNVGARTITFTGSATSSSLTGISTSFLPFMSLKTIDYMTVAVATSTGTTCEAVWYWYPA